MLSFRTCLFLIFSAALCTAALRAADLDALKLGAKPDGATLNTGILQAAIDACSKQGGGVIHFPAGNYLTATLQLKDNVTLRLKSGAVLLSATNGLRNISPFVDGSGHKDMGYAFICAADAHNIGIEGAGVIDGRGKAVADAQRAGGGKYLQRPFLVRLLRCAGVHLQDVTLMNSGAWTCHISRCRQVAIHHVTIHSIGLSNNDGIDIDASHDVQVRDCNIRSDDDSIVLKTTSAYPCSNISVSGCTLNSSQSSIKCGTESVAPFEHIRVSDCKVLRAKGGIQLFSVDGSRLHDVRIDNIDMRDVDLPIILRLGARLHVFQPGAQPSSAPGSIEDVAISNITATNCHNVGILASGVPGYLIKNVTLANIDLQLSGGGTAAEAAMPVPEHAADYPSNHLFGSHPGAWGVYLRHVDGFTITNLHLDLVKPDQLPWLTCEDAHHVKISVTLPPSHFCSTAENISSASTVEATVRQPQPLPVPSPE